MSHVPHDLLAEFAEDAQVLQDLKRDDPHLRNLSDRHHEVNREIHRIESEVEAASDQRLEDLKKQRLALADEVAAIIARAKAMA